MQQMTLEKNIPVSFGTIEGNIYGGPFRRYLKGTRRLVGVKMAAEIDHPYDFKVDTEDFSIPEQSDMQRGILFGLQALSKGNDVYAGCMGGIGRTGLYMACMAKVMIQYAEATGADLPVPNTPVAYVRAHYLGHAVETASQQNFVARFDTSPMLAWLGHYHQPQVQTVEKVVYLGPVSWVLHSLQAAFKAVP